MQVVRPPQAFWLSKFERFCADLADDERAVACRERIAAAAAQPFDLRQDLPLRVAPLRLADEEFRAAGGRCTTSPPTAGLTASDGRNWTALYAAYSQGAVRHPPELRLQYADYASWQREYLQGALLEKQLAYWKRQLAGAPAVLELPHDHSRPAPPMHGGAQRSELLCRELTRSLEELKPSRGRDSFHDTAGRLPDAAGAV